MRPSLAGSNPTNRLALLRAILLLFAVEAGLALGALLWQQTGDQRAAAGTSPWSWLAAALLFTCLAWTTWLAVQSFQHPARLEDAFEKLEQLSRRPGALAWLSVIFFLALLLGAAALAPPSPHPIPELIARFQAALLAFLPLFAWLCLAAVELIAAILILFPPARLQMAQDLLLGGLISLLLVLYWQGAVQQLVLVNDNLELNDQGAYMNFTRRLFESGYTYLGGFNRMPAYPFYQALFYRPGMGDEELFLQGKYLNLLLSLVMLAGFAWFFFRHFRPLLALNLLLILAFLIFIFKAGFYQAELLFYFLNFFLFWCLWRLLQEPSWGLAGLAGLLAGTAHLTKASILPGLVLFLVFGLLQVGWNALGSRQSRSPDESPQAGSGSQPALSHAAVILLVGVIFLLSVSPYLQYSKRIAGRYFYNVNSTFYLWYDSWQEARQGTRAAGDREGWPDMPADQLPSLSKYLREHTKRRILNRFVFGFQAVMDQVIHSYGYFRYILIIGGLFLAAAIFRWRRAWNWIISNPVLLLFLLAYFGIYFLLYFWYAPISAGNRLILGQLIPFVVMLSLGWQSLLEDAYLKAGGRPVQVLTVLNLAIFLLLMWDIFDVVTRRILVLYGGD
jgi:hypothetical protein